MPKEQTNRNQKKTITKTLHVSSRALCNAIKWCSNIIDRVDTRLMRNVFSHWYSSNRQSLNVFVRYMRYHSCLQLIYMPELIVIWIKIFWLLITGDFSICATKKLSSQQLWVSSIDGKEFYLSLAQLNELMKIFVR